MEFFAEDYEKISRRTKKLFNKYQQQYNLSSGQATGKVLYELENTFEENPLFELYAYVELHQINEDEPEVLRYLMGLVMDWIKTHLPVQTIRKEKWQRSVYTHTDRTYPASSLRMVELHRKFEGIHEDLNLVFL